MSWCTRLLTDDHADLVREAVSFLCHQIMEAEVSAQIGAGLHERAPEARATQRNGYRERPWDTRAGSLELFIPKLRAGSYFPSGCATVARRNLISPEAAKRANAFSKLASRPSVSTASRRRARNPSAPSDPSRRLREW
jgi:hypothetical protein